MPQKINPLIGIGVPTWGKVSVNWARAFRHIGGPLGSSAAEFFVENEPIADARNKLMEQAIANGCDFLFTLADDVIVQGDVIIRLLQRLWDHPEIDAVTGVYWTKNQPSHPYIWRGMQRGPYLDWKIGEFFPIDFAGCDCLMVRLSERVRALGPTWYSTTWAWEKDQPPADMATEDFYFYTRLRQAGISLWCDSGVQCLHEDRASGMLFGLQTDMPQAGGVPAPLPDAEADPEKRRVLIADLGAGQQSPYFGDESAVKVVRFDGDETVRPDYRCDLRHLPAPDQSFDVVHARHVLEHFGRGEDTMRVLGEWLRILRVGGELRLSVPNFVHALRWILAQEEGRLPPDKYPWWQVYGAQTDHRDFHHNGWTPTRLRLILERMGVLEDVVVEECDGGINLQARARKARHPSTYALSDTWEEIVESEGRALPGFSPRAKDDDTKQAGSPAEEQE